MRHACSDIERHHTHIEEHDSEFQTAEQSFTAYCLQCAVSAMQFLCTIVCFIRVCSGKLSFFLSLALAKPHPPLRRSPSRARSGMCILAKNKLVTLLDLCVSSLRRGHANLLCIVPTLTDDPRKVSIHTHTPVHAHIHAGREARKPHTHPRAVSQT